VIKLAHLADTHIGMENYGRINPETGLNQRLHDFLNSLDQALDAALASQVDLVIIAGDIYKTRDPTPTHQREFAKRIHRLSRAGVHTVIVAGNHDIPLSTGRATSIDIFRALEIENVTVARTIGTHRIETKSGPVQVVAFPWSVRSLAQAHPDFKNRTIADLNQAMIELNQDKLREQAEQLDPHTPAILVGHTHLFGARIGAERLLTMGTDPIYDPRTVDLPNLDYVALGHIHKHQALSYTHPPVVYSGSIDRVDFGEEHEDKGWVYVEIPEKGRAEWHFRKVDARPFLSIDAHVEADAANATEEVVKAIALNAHKLPNAVVKVRIDVAPERLNDLQDDAIRAQLKTAYYVLPLERTLRQRPRGRWASSSGAIQRASPLEALALYLDHQKVPAQRKDVLLRYARELMGVGSGELGVGDEEGPPNPNSQLPTPRAQRA
jgi:exonuclease SbcD